MFTDDASPEEIRKARIALYAGAVSVLSALTAAAETGEDKVAIRALRQINREIKTAARERERPPAASSGVGPRHFILGG